MINSGSLTFKYAVKAGCDGHDINMKQNKFWNKGVQIPTCTPGCNFLQAGYTIKERRDDGGTCVMVSI